jgi:hypothetical protein
VFFWPTEDRLLTLLGARAYRNQEHDVITIDTATLLARHGDTVRLSEVNSGSTLYPNAPKRGRGTFRTVPEHPKERAVAEVAVREGIADVRELVVAVELRKGRDVLATIYRP